MILIVDLTEKSKPLAKYEFVMPIAYLLKGFRKDYEIKHYTEIQALDDYEKIILSGTALQNHDLMAHIEYFDWIKTCSKPILGICAGMQVISMAFGSKLVKNQEIGMTKIETLKDNALFSGYFEAYSLHNYAVEVSDKIEVLASSKKCVQGVKVRGKEIYGVLFHPEVRNVGIIENFICGQNSRA